MQALVALELRLQSEVRGRPSMVTLLLKERLSSKWLDVSVIAKNGSASSFFHMAVTGLRRVVLLGLWKGD
jgi:hypothetical protein